MLASEPFPSPLFALSPPGSLVFSGSADGSFAMADETDSYALPMDGGQFLTITVATTSPTVQTRLQLADPGGSVVASIDANGAGNSVTAQGIAATAAGEYRLHLTNLVGVGDYRVTVTLNALHEQEGPGQSSNNTIATAENIEAGGATAHRGRESAGGDGPAGRKPGLVPVFFVGGAIDRCAAVNYGLGAALGDGNAVCDRRSTDRRGNRRFQRRWPPGPGDGELPEFSQPKFGVGALGQRGWDICAPITTTAGRNPVAIAIGQFNADNHLDLVIVNTGTGANLSVLLGDGTGHFSSVSNVAVGAAPVNVAVGDVTGDSILDLLTTDGGNASTAVSLLAGNGDGTFDPFVPIVVGSRPRNSTVRFKS